jgi:hypothetical protein
LGGHPVRPETGLLQFPGISSADDVFVSRINNIVGTRSYPGNPYDGHTLADQLQ